jgi:hypothetical protein
MPAPRPSTSPLHLASPPHLAPPPRSLAAPHSCHCCPRIVALSYLLLGWQPPPPHTCAPVLAPLQMWTWPGKGIFAVSVRKPEREGNNPNCTGFIVNFQWLSMVSFSLFITLHLFRAVEQIVACFIGSSGFLVLLRLLALPLIAPVVLPVGHPGVTQPMSSRAHPSQIKPLDTKKSVWHLPKPVRTWYCARSIHIVVEYI